MVDGTKLCPDGTLAPSLPTPLGKGIRVSGDKFVSKCYVIGRTYRSLLQRIQREFERP